MKWRLLTLRYSSGVGGFDGTVLEDLQRDREVMACTPHFFEVGGVPHVSLLVGWQEAPIEAGSPGAGDGAPAQSNEASPAGAKRPDPTAGLCESDRVLFQTVRRWRSDVAREEGMPPYVILTNRELLAVIEHKPDSLTALSNIPGLGAKKVKRHGERLLRALHGARRHDGSPTSAEKTGTEGAVPEASEQEAVA